ncbi:MAG: response regulator [Prolixibacteraceae bacterium]|nr:response regulator [Prolixibacteraceae bacterium]
MGDIKKVLIAEDSPTQALKLQMILEERGYEVLYGSDGLEAMDLLDENNPPDIIISDIVMPKMDGYEFCHKVKQNEKTRDIPVILLTHLSDPEDVIKGLQSGADNFISKPYSEKFLFERIGDILLNKEIRQRSPNLDIALEIYFGGQKYKLNSNRLQILDLLLSTYYNAINKNKELEEKNEELKKLHKEMKVRNAQLKRSNDEKNQLLGIAAHDLRSPLSTIAGYIDLVDYQLAENAIEDQKQIFTTINMMLEYMLKLISEVLDFSKIESGKLTLNKEEFNLIPFIDQSIMLNNILGAKKNIVVHPEYSLEKVTVNADQNKLKQVMDNLFSNAFKYSDRETNVHVDIEILEDEVRVKVADEGKGIPQGEIGKLFQPFTTTSVKSTAGETSTGLGLVSVKKIVETHGGRIWVESEEGVGSQFFFTIPYNPEKDAEIEPNSVGRITGSQHEKLKVLVVEDEEISDEYLSIISFDISREILHASSGAEAVEICKQNPDIELILMDIKMPKVDGYEATLRIREFNRNVIIIAQTAYALQEGQELSLAAGCNDFITKPIKKEELLEKINKFF